MLPESYPLSTGDPAVTHPLPHGGQLRIQIKPPVGSLSLEVYHVAIKQGVLSLGYVSQEVPVALQARH